MEKNLLRYIWRHSRKDQLWMLAIILLSMPTYFLSLQLPVLIVNGPIQGVGFENFDDVAKFLEINLPFAEFFTGSPIQIFEGFELDRLSFLMALSFSFLALVIANGLFKLYINTFKGRMGERILRRMRFELFDRVLRYPLPRFRRVKSSEIATIIKDEVEPMGEFIGDAYTLPLFAGGQALTGLAFVFVQNWILGTITIAVILFQAWLIPLLRRRLLELGRKRQIAARKLAGRLGEVVDGIQDAHTNDTTNYERARVSNALSELFFIRFDIFKRKFSVKFINNLLIQMLAFIFYAAGGYFAITGRLDIGQLVGVIAAYKDLPGPIRTLIDYDQQRLIVEVRYEQVIEQFDVDNLQEPELQKIAEGPIPKIERGFEVRNLKLQDDTGSVLIDHASTEIKVGERVAVVGRPNSGATYFSEVLARVVRPTAGRCNIDGTSIWDLPEHFTGRRISYVDSNSFFPQGTIFEVLTYVLRNQPVRALQRDATAEREYQRIRQETKLAGNYDSDIDAQWLDLERIKVKDEAGLYEEIRSILKDVEIEEDIRGLGLRGTLNHAGHDHSKLKEELLKARETFRNRLRELGLDGIVEPFDPEKYNTQATIAENLLFGTAIDDAYQPENLATNKLVRDILKRNGLEEQLFQMGKEVAATTIELFGDLSQDNPFFDQLTYMDPEDIPVYRSALQRIGDLPLHEISEADRLLISRLPSSYTEDRNRLGLLSDQLKESILQARRDLRSAITTLEGPPPVAFYNPETYNDAASVLDNVLLGRVSSTAAEGPERVSLAIQALLDEMNLTDDLLRIGLEFNIGTAGKRLSETQRQKLHLARAVLKKPDFLIVNQALNTLDSQSQKNIIDRVFAKTRENGFNLGLIWVPMNPQFASVFDRILLFDDGELIAEGTHEELLETEPKYTELIS